jgi:ABC-2 type transport system permease protein
MDTKLEFERRSKLYFIALDSLVMIKRSSRHIIRNTDQLLGTFFQPIMFILLFSAVFGGAIELALPQGVSYINYLMAGIIVQTVAFGSTTTAVSVCNDLQKGIVDRFKSLPMSNLAVLNGHVISDQFRNGISTIVMIIVGLIIGFRSSASVVDWLTIALILGLFTLAFSWLSAIVGMLAKTVEGVQWISFVLVLPLTFASSAFVPTSGMPAGLRFFAENQPISHVIEATRALMLGVPTGNHVTMSIVWSVAMLLIALPVASYLFRKKTAN